MSLPTVGSVWSVAGIPDGTALVIAGPFGAPEAAREFLIAPLYEGSEPGFTWTNWDVLIRPEESPFDTLRYAAVWNVRPVLEYDLDLQLGDVTSAAVTAVRDVYWASLNEQKLGPDPRLGQPLRSWKSLEAGFQKRELDRWKVVSGRVISAPQEQEKNPSEELKRHHWSALRDVMVSFRVGGLKVTDTVGAAELQGAPNEVYDYLVPALNATVSRHLVVRFYIRAGRTLAVPPAIEPIVDSRQLAEQSVPLSAIEALKRESNRLASLFSTEAA